MSAWYPIAASTDLPYGHVYQTMLDGLGLAVWRAVDGRVNVWEDRCPHRGLRFSMGAVIGNELRCQYHAWRFSSGDGRCTHVPAHPDRKAPGAVRATRVTAIEQDGLIWATLHGRDDAPPRTAGEVLRQFPINRPAAVVAAAIALEAATPARLFVQPVTADRSVVRGTAPVDVLRSIDEWLERFRAGLEAA